MAANVKIYLVCAALIAGLGLAVPAQHAAAEPPGSLKVAQSRTTPAAKPKIRPPRVQSEPRSPSPPQSKAPPADPAAEPAGPAQPPENVEVDVSTRSVAVTSSFTGTEIIVFGSVDHSRQTTAEAGYYDVVVVVEGTPLPIVARRKSNVAGIWLNTESIRFASLPSYYAIASTRPLDEIADANIFSDYGVGLEHVRMTAVTRPQTTAGIANLDAFKQAVIRLKEKAGLYVVNQYGVAFIGRSLFRSSIALPANVPVGPLVARVYLFREGRMLSAQSANVTLERAGVERLLHGFAFQLPLLYGLATVLLAVSAGLFASTLFRRWVR